MNFLTGKEALLVFVNLELHKSAFVLNALNHLLPAATSLPTPPCLVSFSLIPLYSPF